MIQIEVDNFQSIEHASIQVRGFTALVGRSNLGKSAIVRAVKAALTGAPSTSFVRHAQDCPRVTKGAKTCKCFCSVHIQGDGLDLLWEKGDSINRYTHNGQVYDKAERGTPEFLQPAYSLVKIGDDKELLQVSDQFNPIFLLNQTGGVVADVLSDVAHLDRVNVATRLAEKDRKEAASTRKVRERDVVDLTQRLVRFDGLEIALAKAADVEACLSAIEKIESKVAGIEKFLERSTALGKLMLCLEDVTLIAEPDPTTLGKHLKDHQRVSLCLNSLNTHLEYIRALQPIGVVVVPKSDNLQPMLTLFGYLDIWLAKLRVFKTWLGRTQALSAAPVLAPDPLRDTLGLFQKIKSASSRFEDLARSVGTLENQAEVLRKEGKTIQAEWTTLGVCPTCTQTLSAEHCIR